MHRRSDRRRLARALLGLALLPALPAAAQNIWIPDAPVNIGLRTSPYYTNITARRDGDLSKALKVNLRSSDTNVFNVPESTTFDINRDDADVFVRANAIGSAHLLMTASNHTAEPTVINVLPPITLAVAPSPLNIFTNHAMTATAAVVRAGAAAGDLNTNTTVNVASADPAVFTVAPAVLNFPATAARAQTNFVTVTAVASGSAPMILTADGILSVSNTVNVYPESIFRLEISPDPIAVIFDDGPSATARIVRHGSVPGDLNENLTVLLTGDDPAVFSVTGQVDFTPTMALAQTNTFTVTGVAPGVGEITAAAPAAPKYAPDTATVLVSQSAIREVRIVPDQILINLQDSVEFEAELVRQGTSEGDLNAPLTVRVSSSDEDVFTVWPTNVVFPATAGSYQTVSLLLSGKALGQADLHAVPESPDYEPASASVTVARPTLVLPADIYAFTNIVIQSSVSRAGGDTNLPLAVTLSQPAGPQFFTLRGDGATFQANVTVTIPAGAAAASFEVRGLDETPAPVTLTAAAASYQSAQARVHVVTDRDSNNDGIPDWWYAQYFPDRDPAGLSLAYEDPDGDGLWNITEYRAGLNPLKRDTFGDGIPDGERDSDGDGLSNLFEQNVSGTRVDMVDTDDDGLTDWEEVTGMRLLPGWTPGAPVGEWIDPAAGPPRPSDPLCSRSPYRRGSLALGGNGHMAVPDQERHALNSWTLQAWVNPDELNSDGGVVIRRRVFNAARNLWGVNYEMGLEPDGAGELRLYARYAGVRSDGQLSEMRVNGRQPSEFAPAPPAPANIVPRDAWTHLAASYDAATHAFIIYIDGREISRRIDAMAPTGLGFTEAVPYPGELTVGGGRLTSGGIFIDAFAGKIDDVMIFGGASDPQEILASARGEDRYAAAILGFPSPVGMAPSPPGSAFRAPPPQTAVQRDHVPGAVLVRFNSQITPERVRGELAEALGLEVERGFSLVPVYLMRIKDGASLSDKLAELQAHADVEYAEPNYILRRTAVPNDPLFGRQWALEKIDAPGAWARRAWGANSVRVAVIDTGIDYTHPDLWPNIWHGKGYDFYNDHHDPMDAHGHGTHVAGIIGAVGNNGIGIAGVNWRADMMGLRIMSSEGEGTLDLAIAALEYAVLNGARISNNSYGGAGYSQAMFDAVAAAGRKGHLFVAAAGNDGLDIDFDVYSPASLNLPNMLTVAAADEADAPANFSNYGAYAAHLAAPGVGIVSALPGGLYGEESGTSMAAPHVAGVAALIMARNPYLSPEAVRNLILGSVDRLPQWDGLVLSGGRLNAARALGGRGALVAFFTFNDAGVTVEDFTVARDWENDWEHAGRLVGDAVFDFGNFYEEDFDSNNDGIPDWWYAKYFPDRDPAGSSLADDNYDGTGIPNYWQYRLGADPYDAYSLWRQHGGPMLDDGEFDSDGDGLTNWEEIHVWGTDPTNWDTDDDGISDGDEVNPSIIKPDGRRFTSPVCSRSPLVHRSLVLEGTAVVVPSGLKLSSTDRFDLQDWTIEAWVRPDTVSENGSILRRVVNRTGLAAFELRLDDNVPSARFQSDTGAWVTATGAGALPALDWTHLAAVWESATRSLTLYANGRAYRAPLTQAVPHQGAGITTIGEGLNGHLDDLVIWGVARKQNEIVVSLDSFGFHLEGGEVPPDSDVEPKTYEGIYFPLGDRSFADQVVSFVPGGGDANQWLDPQLALGPPVEYVYEQPETYKYVSLGEGGVLVLKFLDNLLTGSGDATPDLHIFEVGAVVEGMYVAISADGQNWIEVGHVAGATSSIDIDPFISEGDVFAYVRLTDDGNNGAYDGESPGPDISGVGAISTVLVEPAETVTPVAWYPFDDGGATAEDFVHALNWSYALEGVVFDSDVYVYLPGELDTDGDGIPDWWEQLFFGSPTGADAWADPDGDGIPNYWEYRLGGSPIDAYSLDPDRILNDGEFDSDGDGLTNWEEIHVWRTDPTNWDTDDDGISDGDELSTLYIDNEYGVLPRVTSPLDARSPRIPRSLIMSGNHLEAPFGRRFAFIPEEDDVPLFGPTVTLTAPEDGAGVSVRFVDVAGTVESDLELESVRLYNNSRFVRNLVLDADGAFAVTVIISSGPNHLEVAAIDVDGGVGRDGVRVNGDFAAADIRVTQTWSVPGDLDTWLIDPQGRHMGWTSGGPGLPQNVAERIPGSFLDIDDIPGVGPENITVEQGQAIPGEYQVWMNNYSHQGNPMSTVRVLVREGLDGQQYVEFGPRAMPVPDFNGNNPAAWWHVTTITWPSGEMDPPGVPVGGSPDEDELDPDTGIASLPGWTVEAWIKPMTDTQSGAVAAYRLPDGRTAYEMGLRDNRPYFRVASAAGTWYEAAAPALPSGEWTHLAFVYGETERTVRLHVNGSLVSARHMFVTPLKGYGRFFVDTAAGDTGAVFDDCYLDEMRVWSRARNGGMIAANMHRPLPATPSLTAYYHFDDGGRGIQDGTRSLDRNYDLGGWPLPDENTDPKPGPDGIWGTADDIPGGPGPDGHNDFVTATRAAPVYGEVDSDGDGLPDWWETLYYGDAIAADANDDPDGDGLSNLYEYWLGTNPMDTDSDGDGVADGDYDADGDGLSNLMEQYLGTHPLLPDTADNGMLDGHAGDSQPAVSTVPMVDRLLRLDGGFVEMPRQPRFALSDWTVQAWVWPESHGGDVIARQVRAGVWNYRLAVDAQGRATVRFSPPDGTADVELTGINRPLPLETWTHLAATFDAARGRLSLFINGKQAATTITAKRPAVNGVGPIRTRAGEGFTGYMDEAAIYERALSGMEIGALYENGPAEFDLNGMVSFYRFDDGTSAADRIGDRWYGASGRSDWWWGQVEDFAPGYERDWIKAWRNAGTLIGDVAMLAATDGAPVTHRDRDGNNDGIPDWWYARYFPDRDPAGPSLADENHDGTGVPNYWQYRLGADPHDAYSLDPDRLLDDGEFDSDGDGLSNWEEVNVYRTDPTRIDTDDNGLTDWEEVTGRRLLPGWAPGMPVDAWSGLDPDVSVPLPSNPNDSLSPFVQRALEVFGDAAAAIQIRDRDLDEGDRNQFNLSEWTLEAHVMPSAWPAARAPIVRRITSDGLVNFEMGLRSDGRLYARFQSRGGSFVEALTSGLHVIPTDAWSHVAARLSGGKLTLFIDGARVAEMLTGAVPAVESEGRGRLELAAGLAGRLDEIRIWNRGMSDADIAEQYDRTLLFKVSGYGALRVSGNGRMQYAGVGELDRLQQWTLSSWVRIEPGSGPGVIVARESHVTREPGDAWAGAGADPADPDAAALPETFYNYYLGINEYGVIEAFHDYYYFGPPGITRWFNRNTITGVQDLRDGQWHHVAYVSDGTSFYVYVNGNREAVGSLPTLPGWASSPELFLLNPGSTFFGEGLTGLLDEVRVYNYGMSGARVNVTRNEPAQLDDPGLISAFTFDFNSGRIRVREWSLQRDQDDEYGLLGGDAVIDTDENVPFVPINTLGRYVDELPGYWPFDDGGSFAENMMMRHYVSVRTEGEHYPPLGGLIAPVPPAAQPPLWHAPARFVGRPEFDADSDGDGLPDAWEVRFGLDPNSPTGDDGPWGDPDGDGLHNLAELQAGTHPRLFDTSGDGLSDFFSYPDAGPNRYRIFGELYTDFDGMDDAWEVTYGLDPRRFDAHEDADGDGWSNLAEFQAGIDPQTGRFMVEAGANPTDPLAYPRPSVEFDVRYAGARREGDIVIEVYSHPGMDGEPDAVFGYAPTESSYPAKFELRETVAGYLREGDAWFFAFIDNNGNGAWDPGEPAGMAYLQPVDIRWGSLGPVAIGLTHAERGRFAWAPVDGVDEYRVTVRAMGREGAPVVLDRRVAAPRNYIHAQDYRRGGFPDGLPKGGYQWFVYRTDLPVTELLERGEFVIDYPASMTTPAPFAPNNAILRHARNEFVWTMDESATMFRLQVAANPAFTGPLTVDLTAPAPVRDPIGGRVRFTLPYLAGDRDFGDGVYYWRVQTWNPRAISRTSATASFRVDLAPAANGPFSISGDLVYPGKVTDAVFVVQAFRSPGFGGLPEAQVIVDNQASANRWPRNLMPFELRGLRAGAYYLRAFLAQDAGRDPAGWRWTPRYWETQGFVAQRDNLYYPESLRVPVSRSGVLLTTMFRDTDNDRLPDDWEYMYNQNLSVAADYTVSASHAGMTWYDAYAAGRMNISPVDPDAAGADGVPLRIKSGLGLHFMAAVQPAFIGTGLTAAGRPSLAWAGIPGATGRFATDANGRITFGGNAALVYYVQYSADLVNWTDVSGTVVVGAEGGHVSFMPDSAPEGVGFYRLLARW